MDLINGVLFKVSQKELSGADQRLEWTCKEGESSVWVVGLFGDAQKAGGVALALALSRWPVTGAGFNGLPG